MRTLLALLLLSGMAMGQQVDLLIYGATPAGIAAALAAAGDGERVLLVEPGPRVGGMLTNGWCELPFPPAGFFQQVAARVVEAYRPEFGEAAAKISENGTRAEPKVFQAVLEQMLAAQPSIEVTLNWALEGSASSSEADGDAPGPMRALEVALFVDAKGERHSIPATAFIDATYEGDLMAAAGVPYRVGQEGKGEYGESLAPAQPGTELNGYSFHLLITREAANRSMPKPPADYAREDFLPILARLKSGEIAAPFGPGRNALFQTRAPALPHGKYELADRLEGPVRFSLPGANDGWPDGGAGAAIREGATTAIDRPPFSRLALATARQNIMQEHLRWEAGLLYFLQNDDAVPAPIRQESRNWGWCRDEWPENAHLPEQMAVGDARRLLGKVVFTQRDLTPPARLPFGVMVPRQMENLLVACAISASHVGLQGLPLEETWTALGTAAGHAAHRCHQQRLTFQALPAGGNVNAPPVETSGASR